MKLLFTLFILLSGLLSQAQPPADTTMDAKLNTARAYLTGTGRLRDAGKAVALYTECAGLGNAKAMNALGLLHAEGIGVAKSREKGAEWLTKAAMAGHAESWYNLGMLYKEPASGQPDFQKAYSFFRQGAAQNHDQSLYAQGYMHFKGLGCVQDYPTAAHLFRVVAERGRPNSMYMLGLCLRNGYGLPVDKEEARSWLQKAWSKGYENARKELEAELAENSNTAAKEKATSILALLPDAAGYNAYRKIGGSISANRLTGAYSGYLIKYDWSGKHVIKLDTLELELGYEGGRLTGRWKEGDSVETTLKGRVHPSSISFEGTTYRRPDHYSRGRRELHRFEAATLNWTEKDGDVVLQGNIGQFSIKRQEPEKPLYIVLRRNKKGDGSGDMVLEGGKDLEGLKAFPNPFDRIIRVEFRLKAGANVTTRLTTMEGRVVYENKAGWLDAGSYALPIYPQQLSGGAYLLVLQHGDKTSTVKVVKY